jgi:hypothetical protein
MPGFPINFFSAMPVDCLVATNSNRLGGQKTIQQELGDHPSQRTGLPTPMRKETMISRWIDGLDQTQ